MLDHLFMFRISHHIKKHSIFTDLKSIIHPMKISNYILLLTLFIVSSLQPTLAQRKKRNAETKSVLNYNEELYKGLEWRLVGPFRGGRSCAVTGVPGNPHLFYFGSTGGGIWKTQDGGQTWATISDGFFGGSIGAIAVSESDPNIIYAGGGEKTVRGNVSHGYGIWKSNDSGKTWKQYGLENSRHISRIRIHPDNPDLAYVAVLGDIYKSSDERGVYRTTDGGKNWEKVLFINTDAGAVDLILDPFNPRVIYSSTWNIRRTPFSLESGGPGSGLWQSTDGGNTWDNLNEKEGFPKGTLGIIGIAVSPVKRDRVWALVESEDGGVFRSEDGGDTWNKLNSDRSLRQRAWYYTRIYADTRDEDVVYVLNVAYHKSKDGGRTFKSAYAPHGDHHDLWIDPENPERMIIGDDGGAQVTTSGGDNWTTYHNQPTAQFYRVTTDNHFPYRIYGAQQDNSTVRILHRTDGYSISEDDWEPTAGGESAHIAVDPLNNEIVYGGSYGGFLTRYNHSTSQYRAINVWPDNPMGHGAEGMKYRFQWNFPIFFSPHDPKKLFACSNYIHVSYNEGQSWETISPDLTRNDTSRLGPSGGPITKDNTGVEYYCTVFAAVESQHEKGVIWTGSDDGLIHITRDNGKTWNEVTPPGMPEWIMINSLETNPFNPGGMYVAATMYKSGDFKPYLYKTKDYGQSWEKITNGIDEEHFTRVVRADPQRKGLLYAGTETGMYISFDDGTSWKPFQQNLPVVPITDLAVKSNNLIAATQGRSFWIIDDLTPVREINKDMERSHWHIFKPLNSYRMPGRQNKNVKSAGLNHPGGVMVYFYMDQKPDSSTTVSLKFLENDGDLIRSFSTTAEKKDEKLTVKEGLNCFVWDMHYPEAKKFEGMVLWWAQLQGPKAVPGEYKIRMIVNGDSTEVPAIIVADPRSETSQEGLQKQFDFLMGVSNKVTATHEAIIQIQNAKKQIGFLKEKTGEKDAYNNINTELDSLSSALVEIEKVLYQTRNQSNQDPLNYPIRLNNKLAHLMSLAAMGDYEPTDQALAFKDEVISEIDKQLDLLDQIKSKRIPKVNKMIKESSVEAIMIE